MDGRITRFSRGIIDQPGEERAVPESFTLFYSFRAPRLRLLMTPAGSTGVMAISRNADGDAEVMSHKSVIDEAGNLLGATKRYNGMNGQA